MPRQIDSSTIDGNVEFVHSQYSCILTSQVSNITRKTKFSRINWHVFQDWIKKCKNRKWITQKNGHFSVKDKLFILKLSLLLIILSDTIHKSWIHTCDVRIQLYWEWTNSTVPSIVQESIKKWLKNFGIRFLSTFAWHGRF